MLAYKGYEVKSDIINDYDILRHTGTTVLAPPASTALRDDPNVQLRILSDRTIWEYTGSLELLKDRNGNGWKQLKLWNGAEWFDRFSKDRWLYLVKMGPPGS